MGLFTDGKGKKLASVPGFEPKDRPAVMQPQDQAKALVEDYMVSSGHVPEVYSEDVYIVTFSYTLGNWKALVGTTINDGRLYEVTYDKERKRTYLDVYEKLSNLVFNDAERGK